MMKYLIMLIFILSALGYANEINDYFPKGKLDADSWIDNEKIEMISTVLKTMKEPSLWEMSKKHPKSEVYRFILLRSFHNPICIRIEINNNDDVIIYKKEFKQKEEYTKEYIGELIINEEKRISINNIKTVLQQIDLSKFWDLYTTDFPTSLKVGNIISTVSLDGTDWIFEGVKHGKYQLIDVHIGNYGSKELNNLITELGKSFLSIADLEVDPLY